MFRLAPLPAGNVHSSRLRNALELNQQVSATLVVALLVSASSTYLVYHFITERTSPSSAPTAHVVRVPRLVQHGRPQSAGRPVAKMAVAAIPNRAPANSAGAQQHNLAGRQLTRDGKLWEAITELNAAISIDPAFALAYNARGFTWFKLHDYPRAIQDLDTAIRLKPNYANAYQIRSLARQAAGNTEGSASDLKRAKELLSRVAASDPGE